MDLNKIYRSVATESINTAEQNDILSEEVMSPKSAQSEYKDSIFSIYKNNSNDLVSNNSNHT